MVSWACRIQLDHIISPPKDPQNLIPAGQQEHSAFSQRCHLESKHMCTFSEDVTMSRISAFAPASPSAYAMGKLILPELALSQQPSPPRYIGLLPVSLTTAPVTSSLSDMGH